MNRRRFLQSAITLLGLPMTPPPRLLAFGDSITVGTGASDPAHGYARLIADATGMAIDNRAVSLTVATDHLRQIQAALIFPGDTVIFLTGFNDEWRTVPLENYRATLRACLALIPGAYVGNCLRCTEAGYAATPFGMASDERTRAMNAIIAEEVARGGCHLVDAASAYDPRNSPDQAHPNDLGHAQIARAFLAVMRRVVYVGMVLR
jgi:lysophospholipase L1-like esterase